MYFHVYLIYRFTRTFTDHSSVITRCWGFELQNGKSSLKSPQTLATQDFAPASFLSTPDTPEQRFLCSGLFMPLPPNYVHRSPPHGLSNRTPAVLPSAPSGGPLHWEICQIFHIPQNFTIWPFCILPLCDKLKTA